ncbi:MAG TPA: hypothetical protein VLU95_03965 [Candidatus Acidoferrum sp.]|nr:hypothetical protein [Candidatus Acidoferrum sp.]
MDTSMKKIVVFLIAFAFLASLMIAPLNNVSAQKVQQGQPTSDEWAPIITFTIAHGEAIDYMYFYNITPFNLQVNQLLTINLTAIANTSPEGRGVGLLEVFYDASWLNSTVVIYHWSGDPSNLDNWYHTNTPIGSIDYSLVLNNIPLGHQHINFTVVKVALYWGGVFSYATLATNQTIDFTVSNTTSPSSTPTVPEFPLLTIPLLSFILGAACFSAFFKKNYLCKKSGWG